MPAALPVGGKRSGQDLLLAIVQIEIQTLVPPLAQAKLVFALREQIAAGDVVLPGQDVQREREAFAVDLQRIGPVQLDPLILLVQVDGLSRAPLHQLRLAHQMGGDGVRGLVLQRPDALGEAGAHEIPDGAAHELGIGIDDLPEIVHRAAAVAGDRDVFIHERGTHVLGIQSITQFELHGDRIARAHDIFGRMLGRIAAVHPIARGIERLAFLDDLGDVLPLSAFIACTPEQHTGMVAIPEHHTAHPLAVHFLEFGQAARVFGSMGLIPGFVDDVQAVLVGEIQILVHGRIVGSSYSVEIELLEDFKIAAYHLLGHHMAQSRMLHMGALGIHFDGLPVQVEDAIPDFGLLEADPLVHLVHDLSGRVR